MADTRVIFDFDISFSNGGGVQGQDFRLDIFSETITDQELGEYIIRDLRLLMVDKVSILNKHYIKETHKRKITNTEDGSRFIDLSHVVFDGLITYKGLPAPVICDYLSRENSKEFYDNGTSFQIGKIEMVTNTGTYLDCPFHRFENGKDLSEILLEQCADLEAVTINAVGATEISKNYFVDKDLKGKAVLVCTGWSKNWNTEKYFEGHPFLTEEAAAYLRDCQVKLVGIDSHNIDNTALKTRPVHTTLLGADILIIEHLCKLEALPENGYRFSAVPPKFKGAGTFPVRAYATLLS